MYIRSHGEIIHQYRKVYTDRERMLIRKRMEVQKIWTISRKPPDLQRIKDSKAQNGVLVAQADLGLSNSKGMKRKIHLGLTSSWPLQRVPQTKDPMMILPTNEEEMTEIDRIEKEEETEIKIKFFQCIIQYDSLFFLLYFGNWKYSLKSL